MQSATGQYSTQAGDPAQQVQHSVITASSFGFFLRAVVSPVDLGSNFSSSGTIPAALEGVGLATVSAAIECLDYTVKMLIFIEPREGYGWMSAFPSRWDYIDHLGSPPFHGILNQQVTKPTRDKQYRTRR